ncbi:MAG TPA: DUF4097 family beta strand repeat-containing protein [Gaiellaceae bacterium]
MSEQRFHTPEPAELEIRVPTGDIDVETVEGDESTIELDGDERLIELTEVRQEGRRIVVELKGKKPFGITISIGDFSFGSTSLRVRARIPHHSRVELATASADMKLRGVINTLDVKSASGDLSHFGEIEGNAAVKTVSGDARIERVGGELRIQTVSGDVNAAYVGGSVNSKSVSGDVRVDSVREGSVNAQSVSGDIEIGVAPGTKLDVDAGSVSGDLTSEVPLGSEPNGFENGDGPMLVVRGKTVSGDFRVFRG